MMYVVQHNNGRLVQIFNDETINEYRTYAESEGVKAIWKIKEKKHLTVVCDPNHSFTIEDWRKSFIDKD